MNSKKQKRIFLRTIGGNEETFKMERELEKAIAQSILSSSEDKRESAYDEGYEKLHKFFLSVSNREFIYHRNLHRAIWKQFFICRIIGKKQKVLETGCGEGLLSIALASSGNSVTGTDISECCILMSNMNKTKFGVVNAIFSKMNATKLDFFSNTFDWVISEDVIEHLHPTDAKLHLREAARVLKPKGKYLLITPNAKSGIHAGSTHIREYTYEDLKELFVSAGFSVRTFLLPIVVPVNALINVEVKLLVQRLVAKLEFAYPLMGLDPIFLVASKL